MLRADESVLLVKPFDMSLDLPWAFFVEVEEVLNIMFTGVEQLRFYSPVATSQLDLVSVLEWHNEGRFAYFPLAYVGALFIRLAHRLEGLYPRVCNPLAEFGARRKGAFKKHAMVY